MKSNIFYFAAVLLTIITSEPAAYDYDKGYQAAWDGESRSKRASKDYSRGYDQGEEDVYVYETGYYDSQNGKKPAYPNDCDYMDGYRDAEH